MSRRAGPLALASACLLALAVPPAGCSSGGDPGGPALPDARAPLDAALAADAPPADGSAPPDTAPSACANPQPEVEPNDGRTADEYQKVPSLPAAFTGAIDPADDIDLFGVAAAAGDRFTVTLTATGSGALAPHLVVFGAPSLNVPPAVNAGPGGELLAEYYVLKAGLHYVGVRDRRNVGTSAHVGGPDHTYRLCIERLARAPMPVTVGGSAAGAIDPPGRVEVFAFTATQGDDLDVSVFARRLQPPSDIDSRLSLFFPAQKAWLGTNDDLAQGQPDSLLHGALPFTGTYHAIVENVAPAPVKRSFELRVTKH